MKLVQWAVELLIQKKFKLMTALIVLSCELHGIKTNITMRRIIEHTSANPMDKTKKQKTKNKKQTNKQTNKQKQNKNKNKKQKPNNKNQTNKTKYKNNFLNVY